MSDIIQSRDEFEISIKKGILFYNGKKFDDDYFYGSISLVTDDSKPFIVGICWAEGWTETFVFEELMRQYREWKNNR